MELSPVDAAGDVVRGPRGSAARSIGLTTVTTAVVYAATLLQQALYGRALGVNGATDALAAALVWGVATTGFVGTTITSVLLPAYVQAAHRQVSEGRNVLRAAWVVAIGISVPLALLTLLGAAGLATLLGPGLAPDDRIRLADLLRITSPLQVVWVASWMCVAIANANERYVLAAASAILPPLPVLATFVLSTPRVEDVANAYVLGAILQVAVLIVAGRGGLADLASSVDLGVVRHLLRRLVQVGAAFATLGAVPLLVRVVASLGGEGDVAVSDYASRLALAGEQVVLSGVLAVVFTRWSAAVPDLPIEATVSRVIAPIVVAAVAIPLVANDLISFLFVSPRFSAVDVDRVATFLTWMAPGVAAHMLLMVIARALLARSSFGSLITASAIAAIVLAVVAIAGHSVWGLEAVAVAYSAAWLAAVWVAIVGLHVSPRALAVELLKSLAMAGAGGLAAWAALRLPIESPALRIAAAGVTFSFVAVVAGHAIGVAAVRDIEHRLSEMRSHA